MARTLEMIFTGDYENLMVEAQVILSLWTLMAAAVGIDMWSGVISAKARGEKIYSGGLRRTFSKLGDYWRIQVMALIFDCVGSLLEWYNLPYASMITTAAIVMIEARSVWENEKAKKSNASKIPSAIKDILTAIQRRDIEGIVNFMENLKKLDELSKTKNNDTKGIQE